MAHNFDGLLSNIIILKYITQQKAMKAPHALIPWKEVAADKDPDSVPCGRTCAVTGQQQAAGTTVSVTQEYRGNSVFTGQEVSSHFSNFAPSTENF